MTRVAVTGAGGFLGGALASRLRAEGDDVVELRRDGAEPFNLAGPHRPGRLTGIDVLVHAAWDLRTTEPIAAWRVNVEGSRALLEAARRDGVGRVVFVSSMSAYFGTRQVYGLTKLAVERTVLEADGVVARPGLVYGAGAGGMMGTLRRLSRLPVIPSFPGASLFTAHVTDVLDGLVTLVRAPEAAGAVVGLAHPVAVPFDLVMSVLAREAGRSRLVRVPVPWPVLLGLLRVGSGLGLPLPVRPDSLLGLVRPAPSVPGRDLVGALGVAFRPFPDGLAQAPTILGP